MNAIDELIETIAKADSSSWDIADHVAAIPQKGEEGYRPLQEIADEIYERLGVEWSPKVLGSYRSTAVAFPREVRTSLASFNVHAILRASPDKLTNWVAKNPDKRMPSEVARNLRGGMSAPKAERDAWKVKFSQAWKTIDALAENDPIYALDAVEQLARNIRARFPKALAKGAPSGLRAV